MFINKRGFFQYYVIMGGETHLIEVRSSNNPVNDSDFFKTRLNEDFLLQPCWDCVCAVCFSSFREEKRQVVTYISAEIHYDMKKPIFEAAKEEVKSRYPNTFHEIVELPGGKFPHLEGMKTMGRGRDGYWTDMDLPTYRAVFASKQASESHNDRSEFELVDGVPFEKVSSGTSSSYRLPLSLEDDRFVYRCSSEKAQRIHEDGVIPSNGSIRASSLFWGSHSSSGGGDKAVVFKTSQTPSHASYNEGAVWEHDLSLKSSSITHADNLDMRSVFASMPDPRLDDSEDVVVHYGRSKNARLPLGEPGGPCHLIRHVEETRLPDVIKEELREDVREDGEFEKDNESLIYDQTSFRMRNDSPFNSVKLTHHVQHRMDQRSITVEDIKDGFEEFGRWYSHRKQNPGDMSREDEQRLRGLQKGQKMAFEADRKNLKLVFRMGDRRSELILITAYWMGKPDPNAPSPGECSAILERASASRDIASRYRHASCDDCECEGEKDACSCDSCDCREGVEQGSMMPSEGLTRYHGWASHYYQLRS
jgi:hypothetical protein